MSKMRLYKGYNTLNKSNLSSSYGRYKPKSEFSSFSNYNQYSTEINNHKSNNLTKNNDDNSDSKNNIIIKVNKKESLPMTHEEPAKKTPEEILSSLLKNSLGKSLLRLEKNTKEQNNTLKLVGKYFLVFEKNLLLLENGVEKKKKEIEKQKKLAEKKRINSINKLRSRTVQSNRKIARENSVMSQGRTTNNKYNTHLKTNSTILKGKNNVESPKIRSKTVRGTRYPTKSIGLKTKNINNLVNSPKNRNININNYRTNYKSPGRSTKNNENSKDEENHKFNLKSSYNTVNNNLISNSRENIRTKSKKREINSNKDKDKDKGRESRSHRNTKNIKVNKNGHEDKNKKILNNLNIAKDIDKTDSPKIRAKEPDIKISNFSELDGNIIDNNKNKNLEEEKDSDKLIKDRLVHKNKKNGEISVESEIEDSLNDVKNLLNGVNGVLNKINKSEKKIKFEKRKKSQKDLNNEDKKENELNDKNENNEEKNKIEEDINKKDKKEENLNVNENNLDMQENNNNKEMIQKEKINEVDFPIKESIKNGNESLIVDNEAFNNKNIDNNNILNNNPIENDMKNSEAKPIDENNNNNNNNNNENNLNNDNNKINVNSNEVIITDNSENRNLINELDKKIEEKEKEKEKEKEELKTESNINQEQLTDANQSSINQSSILNQTAILAEQYVLISRDPDAPFTIEDILKFEKTQCLGILDFLNFEEKIHFTGINRGFILERIYLLNNKREDLIRSMDLPQKETVDDLITQIRLKYSNVELSKNLVEFQASRGGIKAVELLNNDLYGKLFKKPILEKNAEEICIIYRVLFALFGEYKIATIYGDQLFWIKCTEYLINNSNGKIGTFIVDKFKDITFEHKKIFLLNKLLVGIKKNINPTYYSKICGTTGLLIFIIKDALEYCGVIINEKKTQPARIIDNLMYYKNSIDTLAYFIDALSMIKTYKVREKKDKEENDNKDKDNKDKK